MRRMAWPKGVDTKLAIVTPSRSPLLTGLAILAR
jgi:hypothetical protein